MRMPFGKYKGFDIWDIPPAYLQWLRENCDLFGQLSDEVDEVLEAGGCSARGHESQVSVDRSVLTQIYREMARRWHPDAGGTTSAMQAVNDFYEAIRARI